MSDEEQTSDEGETPKIKPQGRNDDPGMLAGLIEKHSQTGTGVMQGGEIIPRKRISFDVDGAECAPGMFCDANGDAILFHIGLAALSSAQEIAVVKGITDPAQAAQLTAKASIEKINDAPVLPGEQLDFLWESLGAGGRQLVLTMYTEIGALSPTGLGKALANSSRS